MRSKEQIKWLFDKSEDCINLLESINDLKRDRKFYSVLNNLYDMQNFLIMCNEYECDGIFIDFDSFQKKIEKIKNIYHLNKSTFFKNGDCDNDYIRGLLQGIEVVKNIFFIEK